MKTRISLSRHAIAILTLAATLSATVAQEQPSTATASTTQPAATAPKLSYGVGDVLKLSRAKVNQDTIIAFIKNSGLTYGGLSATEIVYLHDQGVSDQVVSTMLGQRQQIAAEQAAATASAQAAAPAPATTVQPTYTQPAPAVTYAEPAPVSTVYYIPSSPRWVNYNPYYYPSYSYSYYRPAYSYCGPTYYGGYRSYYNCAPRVSLSVGIGGFRGGYHGGFRGGVHCR